MEGVGVLVIAGLGDMVGVGVIIFIFGCLVFTVCLMVCAERTLEESRLEIWSTRKKSRIIRQITKKGLYLGPNTGKIIAEKNR